MDQNNKKADIIFGYWNVRANGQVSRLLLEYTGQTNYTNKLYTEQNYQQWFEQDKIKLIKEFPNLPFLIQGDFQLTESQAIDFYIMGQSELKEQLLGKDLLEQGLIKKLFYIGKQLQSKLFTICDSPQYEEMKEKRQEEIKSDLLKFAQYKGNRSFLLGEKVTYPDFLLYEIIYLFKAAYGNEALEKQNEFLSLVNLCFNFEKIPQIKEYLNSERVIKRQYLPYKKQKEGENQNENENDQKLVQQKVPCEQNGFALPQKLSQNDEKIELAYWDGIRARGQSSYYLLAYSGLNYNIKKYTMQQYQEWVEKDKVEMLKKTPFANLPYVKDGELIITETPAVQEYIALRSGKKELLGVNFEEKVKIQQQYGIANDIFFKLYEVIFDKENCLKKMEEGYYKQNLEAKTNQLLEKIGKNGSQFLNGKLPSLPDFVFAECCKVFLEAFYDELHDNSTFEKIKQYVERFENIPEIQEFIKNSKDYVDRPYYTKFLAGWSSGIRSKNK
ncbi:Thioredoxin-like fold [Pseudocohnilembus persalinus]|uniref:glutathione transferase n=1 Tax=Pseudocohnilembus persalinus TaxID=266149 RepID=A0A0V0QD03_PSEPJ|nr:Thioredoxin-like fold [Pseudocohnilembus persalinus]|eukprot:KRX00105.1 Thioredoxin-like fold [Pseudocohnilembus persalinus]